MKKRTRDDKHRDLLALAANSGLLCRRGDGMYVLAGVRYDVIFQFAVTDREVEKNTRGQLSELVGTRIRALTKARDAA